MEIAEWEAFLGSDIKERRERENQYFTKSHHVGPVFGFCTEEKAELFRVRSADAEFSRLLLCQTSEN